MSSKLTKKQEALLADITQTVRRETALAYIDNGYENKTKAYLAACKKLGKAPSKNPETSASEMLGYPNVVAFLNETKLSVAESVQVNAEYVLSRLVEIDQLDILDIIKDDMSGFRLISDWPKSWRTSISAVDMKRMALVGDDKESFDAVVEKVKWPDKVKNLEMMGRHVSVKAFDKETQVINNNNIMPVPVADSVESWEEVAMKQQEGLLGDS